MSYETRKLPKKTIVIISIIIALGIFIFIWLEVLKNQKFQNNMNFKLVLLGENVSVHVQKWIKGILQHPEVEIHVITFNRGTKFEGVHYHYIQRYTKTKLDYFLNVFKI